MQRDSRAEFLGHQTMFILQGHRRSDLQKIKIHPLRSLEFTNKVRKSSYYSCLGLYVPFVCLEFRLDNSSNIWCGRHKEISYALLVLINLFYPNQIKYAPPISWRISKITQENATNFLSFFGNKRKYNYSFYYEFSCQVNPFFLWFRLPAFDVEKSVYLSYRMKTAARNNKLRLVSLCLFPRKSAMIVNIMRRVVRKSILNGLFYPKQFTKMPIMTSF